MFKTTYYILHMTTYYIFSNETYILFCKGRGIGDQPKPPLTYPPEKWWSIQQLRAMWLQGRHWEGLGAVLCGWWHPRLGALLRHCTCGCVCACAMALLLREVSIPRDTRGDCLPRECVHTPCVLSLILSPSRFESNCKFFSC